MPILISYAFIPCHTLFLQLFSHIGGAASIFVSGRNSPLQSDNVNVHSLLKNEIFTDIGASATKLSSIYFDDVGNLILD